MVYMKFDLICMIALFCYLLETNHWQLYIRDTVSEAVDAHSGCYRYWRLECSGLLAGPAAAEGQGSPEARDRRRRTVAAFAELARHGTETGSVWRIKLWKPGLRSRRILNNFDSDSDSEMKISTPTPTPTPLRLRPDKRHSFGREQYHVTIFLRSLLVASKRVIW